MEETMTQETGSQTVTSQTEESFIEEEMTDVGAAFAAFGLTPPKEGEHTTPSDEEADNAKSEATDAAATQSKADSDKKGMTVKFNKEDRFVDETEIPELLQKGLALDKERSRVQESQQTLDRAAKLLGYKDHADLTANLDKIEQYQQQKQKDDFDQLRAKLIDDLEMNGVDRADAEKFLETNPLMQQAKAKLQEDADRQRKEQETKTAQTWTAKWDDLYKAYPELKESASAFNQGRAPEWYTSDMQARISRGYDPKDAYELTHQSTIRERDRKTLEQRLIKEQRLGTRAKVEADAKADVEPEVPADVAAAFSMFGLKPSAAKKYVKK